MAKTNTKKAKAEKAKAKDTSVSPSDRDKLDALKAQRIKLEVSTHCTVIEGLFKELQQFVAGGNDLSEEGLNSVKDLRDSVHDLCIATGIRSLKVWDRESSDDE